MTLNEINSLVAWIAGTKDSAVSIAGYRVKNLNYQVVDAVQLADNNLVGSWAPGPNRAGGLFGVVTFETEFRGSDTADVPPPDGALLRACGFQEQENGTTPNIGYKYTLADPHLLTGTPAGYVDPIDLSFYYDGRYRQVQNCVGSVVVTFGAGSHARYSWTFRGQISETVPVLSAGTPPSFSAQANPIPVKNERLQMTITRTGTVTGSATSTGTGTALADTAASFIQDAVYAGDVITNDTDGSAAVIASVETETGLTTTALTGGSDNTWESGDTYTITRAAAYQTAVGDLIVPSFSYDTACIVDPRDDVSGQHGFSQPIITGRRPRGAMTVEIPAPAIANFEREFRSESTFDFIWHHEYDFGDRHAMTGQFSGVLAALPRIDTRNGKYVYILDYQQGIESGDQFFELSWQGT
jgi:hypothetical protein